VAIGARRAAESEETIRLIQSQGGEAMFVPCDVTRADQVQKLMDSAVDRIAYYASKHGVIGATKAAALEYAQKGIRVNAVCPAVIRTPMSEGMFGTDQEARLLAVHPIGRFGTTEEVADAVVFLCPNKASYITGHALPVDAGLLAR
jgi:NAD(P)-dependent dehydrogenase (short-subunit alcohol dehydrogenase family)